MFVHSSYKERQFQGGRMKDGRLLKYLKGDRQAATKHILRVEG